MRKNNYEITNIKNSPKGVVSTWKCLGKPSKLDWEKPTNCFMFRFLHVFTLFSGPSAAVHHQCWRGPEHVWRLGPLPGLSIQVGRTGNPSRSHSWPTLAFSQLDFSHTVCRKYWAEMESLASLCALCKENIVPRLFAKVCISSRFGSTCPDSLYTKRSHRITGVCQFQETG